MIEITDEYIKDGKLDKEALARLVADVVEIEVDKITFKTNVEFWQCDSLTSVAGATFKKGFKAYHCDNLKQ